MYYPYFLTYILTGLLISVTVFVWALKNHQFSDQQRARFLPLERGDIRCLPKVSGGRFQMISIIIFIIAGIGVSFAAVILALISQ